MRASGRPIIVEVQKCEVTTTIHTLEGDMTAVPGDYIITGVKGELYPCKKEIFEATYDIIED